MSHSHLAWHLLRPLRRQVDSKETVSAELL